jgi:hypothetical protein
MKQDLSPVVSFKKLSSTGAWKAVSLYVRTKSGGICYTCERKYDISKLNAGHFIEKIGNAAIYFDFRNLKAQCFSCNRMLHGNKAVYSLKLIEEYGPDIIKDLHKLAQKAKRWTKGELKQIQRAAEHKLALFQKRPPGGIKISPRKIYLPEMP